MHALPLMLGVLACLAIAYRYYSAFLAAKVAALDDARVTPAHELNDGQNYHPTNKWVLFGHHFAAISGAGPLIGPILAIQYGYFPGLIWLVIGVCLAGAVQDMLVLSASMRFGGRSLAEIARSALGPGAGVAASIAILLIVVIALSGLGSVVVKALGGERVPLAAGTVLELPANTALQVVIEPSSEEKLLEIPAGTRVRYRTAAKLRGESFRIALAQGDPAALAPHASGNIVLPAGVREVIRGSSWGTFTIACTIPIAFLTGLYMYKIRKGRVVEASLLGAAAVLAATVIGNWIPGSPLERVFSLSREGTIVSMAIYGFIASVLPVWLLLCPRDYLSSFLKIGTVALLVAGVMIANPKLEAPAVNQHFVGGGGPYFDGPVFPFVCICIMCGAISGFHALVSSGTTPKMVSRESHVRLIGYGSMLIEGLVGVLALVVAAAMPQGDYWAINIDLAKLESFASTLEQMDAHVDNLAEIERQVGGESLRGRTGGAVTLAVGMSQILTAAVQRVSGAVLTVESLIKYWYHFAIMFEALFILTTIDTGTRIARFLLQEALGKFSKSFGRTDWLPGAVLTTAVVTFGWAALIWSGSIETIWPMFGIGNQLLAALALCLVTTVTIRAGRARYAWVTILPMLYVLLTTTLSAWSLCTGKFAGWVRDGMANGARSDVIRGTLNIAFIAIIFACVAVVIAAALGAWARALKQEPRDPAARGS